MSAESTIGQTVADGAPVERRGWLRMVVAMCPRPAHIGRSFVLERSEHTLGRSSRCDIALDSHDKRMSSVHARLRLENDSEGRQRVMLEDCSSNGCFVNATRVEQCELLPGQVLRVGHHLLLLEHVQERDLTMLPAAHGPLGMVGDALCMRALRDAVARAAPGSDPVLILGETGTGKELVAQAVHSLSERTGPYLTTNCRNLDDALGNALLQGHAKGAFTGATKDQPGLFESAQAGSVFLDEVGDMPESAQVGLFRVLQESKVVRVGETIERPVDVRVIAATDQDLLGRMEAGRFREQLFYRLDGHRIEVPPLRDRKQDVPTLFHHFARLRGAELEPTPDAWEALLTYPWPGNVRELDRLVIKCVALGKREIDLYDLGSKFSEPFTGRRKLVASGPPPPHLTIRRDMTPTADELRAVLDYCDWNYTRAGEFFGKLPRQIHRWMERYGIPREAGAPGESSD